MEIGHAGAWQTGIDGRRPALMRGCSLRPGAREEAGALTGHAVGS
jgi:hypothetical protein